jgi:cupin fold WbuC family metalloprotein
MLFSGSTVMKQITTSDLDKLSTSAAVSPRKRAHHNIHLAQEDPVQRLCVAIEPGTYVRPHRHADPLTWEIFLMLRGSAVFLSFDDAGTIVERTVISAAGPVRAIEIPAGTWHTIASLEKGSVFFEVKQGPYTAPVAGNSASWAPVEGDHRCVRFESWYREATVGDRPPAG